MRKNQSRIASFAPNGIPRWIRVYDNGGETIDRYTVVFTGRYKGRPRGCCQYLCMNEYPFSPQGFCQHDEANFIIDYPKYSHLGKRIQFEDLPKDCQRAVMQDYSYYWRLIYN